MIYQHPLAYLLGLEGIALLRAWAGEYDKALVEARFSEVRQLLDNEALVNHSGLMVNRGDTMTGYRHWSATYDEPGNRLFDCDEPIMYEILDALPAGDALDASRAAAPGRIRPSPAPMPARGPERDRRAGGPANSMPCFGFGPIADR